MTVQMTDPFILEIDEWVFLGADDPYALFDPKSCGLNPAAPHTACWKGFIVQFFVNRKKLYLDKLWVYCEDGVYPPVNGVEPHQDHDGMMVYENIGLPLLFSGVVAIGKNDLPGERYRSFLGPEPYDRILKLTFRDGMLTGIEDASETDSGD